MKFPYIKTPSADPRRKWISRPIIPITLFGPKASVTIDALIDSGADKCLFNAVLGKEISLDIEKGNKEIFGGIEGGQIVTYIHPIQLQIVGIDKKIEIPAGFTDARGVFAILGQEGFFDAFRIKFERDRNIIEIDLVKKK